MTKNVLSTMVVVGILVTCMPLGAADDNPDVHTTARPKRRHKKKKKVAEKSTVSDVPSTADAESEAGVTEGSEQDPSKEGAQAGSGYDARHDAKQTEPSKEAVDAVAPPDGPSEDTPSSQERVSQQIPEQKEQPAPDIKESQERPGAPEGEVVKKKERKIVPDAQKKAVVKKKKEDETVAQKPVEKSEPEEKKAEQPKPAETEEISLQLKNGERFNWRAVREWFEHAQDALKELTDFIPVITDQKNKYIHQRDAQDAQVEKEFKALNLDHSRVITLVDYIEEQIKKLAAQVSELTEDEQQEVQKIKNNEATFVGLKNHMMSLFEAEEAVDAVVSRVLEQVNRAEQYVLEAQGFFNQIPQGAVQAKHGFYQIDALLKSVAAIKTYLDSSLAVYFKKKIAEIDEALASSKEQIDALKKQSIELNAQAQRLQKMVQDVEQRKQEKISADAARAKQDFFTRTMYRIGNFFGSLWARITTREEVAK